MLWAIRPKPHPIAQSRIGTLVQQAGKLAGHRRQQCLLHNRVKIGPEMRQIQTLTSDA